MLSPADGETGAAHAPRNRGPNRPGLILPEKHGDAKMVVVRSAKRTVHGR